MHITFSDLDTIKMKINARIRKQDYYSHQKSYYLREKKRAKQRKKEQTSLCKTTFRLKRK